VNLRTYDHHAGDCQAGPVSSIASTPGSCSRDCVTLIGWECDESGCNVDEVVAVPVGEEAELPESWFYDDDACAHYCPRHAFKRRLAAAERSTR
jgi:hypothetical protein